LRNILGAGLRSSCLAIINGMKPNSQQWRMGY
jgi:hypothetical protein